MKRIISGSILVALLALTSVSFGAVSGIAPFNEDGDLVVSGSISATGNIETDGGLYGSVIGTLDSTDLSIRTANTDRIHVKAGGNVGIGDTTPSYKLDVNGVINATSGIKINGVDVATSSDTYWSAATGGINYSAGNVGIDDTTPVALLDVGGGVKSTVDGVDDVLIADDLEVDGYIYSGPIACYNFGSLSPFYGAQHVYNYTTDNGVSYQRMISLRNTNNLGTSTDIRRLGMSFNLSNDTSGEWNKMGAITYESESSYANDSSLNLWSGGNERLTILDTGLVGIGTIDPSSFVHISGSNPTIKLTDTDTGGNSLVSASSGSGSLLLYADSDNAIASTYMDFNVDGSSVARFLSTGYLGIGDTTPAALLDVGGGTLNYVDGTNDLLVKGDVEVDGSLYVGKTMLSSYHLDINKYTTADNNTYIDFFSDTGGTSDYDFRIIRWAGENGTADIIHRGTGDLSIECWENANLLIPSSKVGIKTTSAPTKTLEVNGSIMGVDYYSGDGTQGMTGTCADGTSLTVKDGLITGCS